MRERESPEDKPNLPNILTLNFQPHELEEMRFCYLSHPVIGIVLWWPKQTYAGALQQQQEHLGVGGDANSWDPQTRNSGSQAQQPKF